MYVIFGWFCIASYRIVARLIFVVIDFRGIYVNPEYFSVSTLFCSLNNLHVQWFIDTQTEREIVGEWEWKSKSVAQCTKTLNKHSKLKFIVIDSRRKGTNGTHTHHALYPYTKLNFTLFFVIILCVYFASYANVRLYFTTSNDEGWMHWLLQLPHFWLYGVLHCK